MTQEKYRLTNAKLNFSLLTRVKIETPQPCFLLFSGCNYGNTSNTDKELLDCLRRIDHKTFAENTKHFLHYPFVGPNVWKPYFDGHNVSNAIFHDHPENLLRSGNYNKVPIIIGTNADEGALNMVGYLDGRGDFAEA